MNKKGFTLIEIIAVVAILAFLAVIVTPNVIKVIQKGKTETMVIHENNVKDAAALYLEDNCFNPIDGIRKDTCDLTSNIDEYRYVCLSTLENENYIDSIKYNDSDCGGVVIYLVEDNKLVKSKTYLQCEKDGEVVYKTSDDKNVINVYNYNCGNIDYNYYNIHYDANNGIGSMEPTKVKINATNHKLRKNTFKRTGYTFRGWNTDKDGFGKSFYDEEYIKENLGDKKTPNITLFAQWMPNTYKINFDSQGGEITNDIFDKEVTYDSEYGKLPIVSKYGYTFLDWYTESNQKITESSIVKITKNETIKAKWKANEYTATFSTNGGTITKGNSSKTITFDSKYGELPEISKYGYTFLGWYDESNQKITESTVVKTTIDLTLTAKWKANEYIATFSTNGGTITKGNSSKTITFDSKYGILSETQKNGYKFTGWWLQNPMEEINENSIVKRAENVTLSAGWKENKVNITYNVGNTGVSISSPVTSDDGIKYYWKTDKNGNILRSTDGNNYTYNFHSISYSKTDDLVNTNYSKYLNLIKPMYKTVQGKEWCTEKNGNGKCFGQGDKLTAKDLCSNVVNDNCNVTLYANWKLDKITYNMLANSYKCKNSSSGSAPYLMEFTGNCKVIQDGGDDYVVKFLSDGKLNFSANFKLDIFLLGSGVSGGGGGTDYPSDYIEIWTGGSGGRGGYRRTINNFSLDSNYSTNINIATSNGGDTLGFGYKSSSGTYSSTNSEGTCAFDDCSKNKTIYGSGGGTGAQYSWYAWDGGNPGKDKDEQSGGSGAGSGASCWDCSGSSATQYGAGGGGGCGGAGSGGSFGSGLVIIRNAR